MRFHSNRALVMLSISLVWMATGCTDTTQVNNPAARNALTTQGEQAYQAGQFAEAERLLSESIEGLSPSAQSPHTRYWRGMSRLALGMHEPARVDLAAAMAQSNDDTLRAMCLRGIGKSYFLERRYQDAENIWNTAFQRHEKHIDGAEILRLMEEAATQRGDTVMARAYHDKLVQRYPGSPYATAQIGTGGEAFGQATASTETNASAAGLYSVQAGVFAERERAESLAHSIRQKGTEAIVVPTANRNGAQYAVRCGSFQTRSAALRRKARLDQLGIQTIIKE